MQKPLPDNRVKKTSAVARGVAAAQGISGRGVIVVLVIIAIFLFEIRAILLPFALAGTVAYAATPLIQWATDRSGLPRSLIATGVFLLIVALVGGMVALCPFIVGSCSLMRLLPFVGRGPALSSVLISGLVFVGASAVPLIAVAWESLSDPASTGCWGCGFLWCGASPPTCIHSNRCL